MTNVGRIQTQARHQQFLPMIEISQWIFLGWDEGGLGEGAAEPRRRSGAAHHMRPAVRPYLPSSRRRLPKSH